MIEPRSLVLLVDDEPRVVSSLDRVLGRLCPEIETRTAGDATEALARLEAEPIATVVTDVHMPGRDGFWLLERMNERPDLRHVPVVVLTGTGEHAVKRRALDLGASDLLAKPVAPADLVARIRASLRLRRGREALWAQARQLESEVAARTAELERARVELLWRLGVCGEYRDNETSNHVLRVGYYAHILGERLGLDDKACEQLFVTAPLHDLGKIAIPDRILRKPGPLTAEEWVVMKRHAKIGAEILRRPFVDPRSAFDMLHAGPSRQRCSPLIEMAAEVAAHHHERWDGTGYPDNLAGQAIPLAARIVAVADVFDALSTQRPYKPPFAFDDVVRIMRRGEGSQFDPEVFAAFEASLGRVRDVAHTLADDRPAEPSDHPANDLGANDLGADLAEGLASDLHDDAEARVEGDVAASPARRAS